jgi:hypothetical protein
VSPLLSILSLFLNLIALSLLWSLTKQRGQYAVFPIKYGAQVI